VQAERLDAAVRAQGGGRQSPLAALLGELRALWAAIDRRLERAADRARLTAHPEAPAPPDGAADGATDAGCIGDGDDAPWGASAFAARLEARAPAAAPLARPLARMLELLERDAAEFPPRDASINVRAMPPPRVVRNFLVRFSTRHTIALTAAFLLGLW